MKNISKLLIAFLYLFITTISAQEKKELGTAYANYFNLNRELPYLHLNKTSFISGENLWFQAYVLNQKTAKLNKETSNLFCTIYDKDGNYKTSKLFLVKNGRAAGNFKIDSTYTDKTYYIKATTNWMRNFKEDASFIQKITIIGNNPTQQVANTSKYDVQVMAEGGHFVEGVPGTVGLVVKDEQGRGVRLKSAELIDQNNKPIKQLLTNSLGLGMARFTYQDGAKYRIIVKTLDGNEIIKKVPEAEKKGLVLNITNPATGFINISLRTNERTLKNFNGAAYTIYIHNTRKITKRTISLRTNILRYDVLIPTKNLLKGINIITVTNALNTPLLERLTFNFDPSLLAHTQIDVNLKRADSIGLTFKHNGQALQYLSASVLPEQSASYHPSNTILSQYLLKPFVRGQIENSDYYFTNPNRKKLAALDLLLLTQGWSKYSWGSIFNNPPTIKYPFEKGINISATIKSRKQKDSTKLLLISSKGKLWLTEPLIDNKAVFSHIYLSENDTIGFTILRPNRLKRPKIETDFSPQLNKENITVQKAAYEDQLDANDTVPLNDFIFNSDVILDEVTIKGSNKLEHESPIRASMSSFKIDGNFPKTQRLVSFLRVHGFKISGNYPDETILNQRGPASILSEQLPTTVYLDDNIIVDRFNNSFYLVSNLNLENFSEIYLTKSFNGTIYLYSNPNSNYLKSTNYFEEKKSPIGFSAEKAYYTPKYYSTTNDYFKKYGAIYWKANVEVDDKPYNLKIPTLFQKNITLYIEGITSDGALIHQIKNIAID